MNNCTTISQAIQLAILSHGPFTPSQLDTADSRYHLFAQLYEVYWAIIDSSPAGKEFKTDPIGFFQTFFQNTRSVWGSSQPLPTDIVQYHRKYLSRIAEVPVFGAIILNYNLCRTLLVGFNTDNKVLHTLPRGKRDQGETPAQTAIREVLEETGLNIEPYLCPNEYISFINKGKHVQFFIVVTPLSGRENLPPPIHHNGVPSGETHYLSWFDLHDQSTLLRLPINRNSMRLLLEWAHNKIRNPQSNDVETEARLLVPIKGMGNNTTYHYSEKKNYDTIAKAHRTYAPVCAGLLSLAFSDNFKLYIDKPHVSYNPSSSFNDRVNRSSRGGRHRRNDSGYAQNNSNGYNNNRATSSDDDDDDDSDDGPLFINHTVATQPTPTPTQKHGTAMSVDELFTTHVSVEDLFSGPVSTIQINNSGLNMNSNSSPTPSLSASTVSKSVQQPHAIVVSPLEHLIPPHVTTATKPKSPPSPSSTKSPPPGPLSTKPLPTAPNSNSTPPQQTILPTPARQITSTDLPAPTPQTISTTAHNPQISKLNKLKLQHKPPTSTTGTIYPYPGSKVTTPQANTMAPQPDA